MFYVPKAASCCILDYDYEAIPARKRSGMSQPDLLLATKLYISHASRARARELGLLE